MREKPKTAWNLIIQKPGAALSAMTCILISAVLNVIEVLVLERFIENFSAFHWKQSLCFAVLFSGICAFYYIQTPLSNYLNQKISLQLRGYLERAVIEKTACISVEALENQENQALLARLQDKPEKRYANGFFSILQIFGGALGTAGIFVLILQNVSFFLPVILLIAGLTAGVFRLIGKNRVALYQARQEICRRGDYLADLLFDRSLAQEKKLFGYTPYIQKLYEEETIQSGRRLFRSIFFCNLILWLYDNLTYLFSASAYLLFLIPLYKGEINIGLYMAIIPALARIGNFFVSVGSNYLPTYQEYRACFVDMEKLSELPEQYYTYKKENTKHNFHELKGENIVFRYPGQQTPVLNGLNFTFQAGKNYALVGENGCGKTTLIKLLMGFYRPESGTITIDGKNIQEMDFGELQSFYSAIFQDFNHYNYTIKENIILSNLAAEKQDLNMESAVQQAGFGAWQSDFPKGYDTMLGNLWEEGTHLSGGQWQRLSIARMLYREAGIYIWDEPTAAFDPLAESQLYTNFLQKRSKSCANIFVTHRLGAAVNADEICVMENGQFVEQGKHNELMQKINGMYHRMFEAQKGMYL